MTPATAPRAARSDTRLLAVDRVTGDVSDGTIVDLPGLLRPGDLVVVNDAATLPASLHARTRDLTLELRLTGAPDHDTARAVLFGAGDWRTPTERRPPPPPLRPGDVLHFTSPEGHVPSTMSETTAAILAVDPRSPRLVTLRFDRAGAHLWAALYSLGRPIQYSHLTAPLDLWSVQTAFAARPWAAEMPSAARPLAWSTLLALRRAGVGVATLTHAAGLSATGDPALDAALPLPERYDLPASTVAQVLHTRAHGGRIVAVGTTVARALEGCVASHGRLRAGPDETDLVLTAAFAPRIVDGLLTGMHDPDESHFHLLRAFADESVLLSAWQHASASGYLQHEFGDATLLLASAA